MEPIGFDVSSPAQLRRFDRVFYAAALRIQEALAKYVREESRPDQLVILEHNPVFTLGRNASRSDIHVSESFLESQGIEIHETDRGGQVTYHGPGQIVVYPICNLRGGREDLGRLVRGLEEAMIRTAADFDVRAERLQGSPGIWVETLQGVQKLGAVGLHLQRWISTHGLAFNVDPDLTHFQWITPCGISDRGVCSLKSLLGDHAPSWEEATNCLQKHLYEVLNLQLQFTRAPSQSVNVITWRRCPEGPEILMMLRVPEHGLWWQSVTGMLEPGENHEEAAHRELKEETGLSGKLALLGLSHSFWVDPTIVPYSDSEPHFNTETCFHMEVARGLEVRLNPQEHSEYRWCTLSEARVLMKWEGSKAALDLLQKQLEGIPTF